MTTINWFRINKIEEDIYLKSCYGMPYKDLERLRAKLLKKDKKDNVNYKRDTK